MQQPTRPARAVRPRHDENAVPAAAAKAATTLKSAVGGAASKENAVVKGEAKRKAFGEISNVAKQVTAAATTKSSGLTDKASKIVLKEKDQVAVKNALAKPAQRGPLRSSAAATNTTTTAATTHHAKAAMPGPARRVVKKTEVYADKRPSPAKAAAAKALSPKKVSKSPKTKAGHIIQREARKVRQFISSQKVALRNSRIDIINQLALSHIQDEPVEAEADDTDADATDLEGENNVEALSDVEGEFDEDDDDFTTARSKAEGNNVNVVIDPVLPPPYTASDKLELAEAGKDFQEVDEDDIWDITMVAEYGDEIFEYMRELEVGFTRL